MYTTRHTAPHTMWYVTHPKTALSRQKTREQACSNTLLIWIALPMARPGRGLPVSCRPRQQAFAQPRHVLSPFFKYLHQPHQLLRLATTHFLDRTVAGPAPHARILGTDSLAVALYRLDEKKKRKRDQPCSSVHHQWMKPPLGAILFFAARGST